jgi:hypothetical protein
MKSEVPSCASTYYATVDFLFRKIRIQSKFSNSGDLPNADVRTHVSERNYVHPPFNVVLVRVLIVSSRRFGLKSLFLRYSEPRLGLTH